MNSDVENSIRLLEKRIKKLENKKRSNNDNNDIKNIMFNLDIILNSLGNHNKNILTIIRHLKYLESRILGISDALNSLPFDNKEVAKIKFESIYQAFKNTIEDFFNENYVLDNPTNNILYQVLCNIDNYRDYFEVYIAETLTIKQLINNAKIDNILNVIISSYNLLTDLYELLYEYFKTPLDWSKQADSEMINNCKKLINTIRETYSIDETIISFDKCLDDLKDIINPNTVSERNKLVCDLRKLSPPPIRP